MESLAKVAVYLYRYRHADGSERTSRLYATMQVLRAGLGAPIQESARMVERAELTDHGLYIAPEVALELDPAAAS